MKAVTLVAVIAIILEVLAGLYFQLLNHDVIQPDRTISQIMSAMFLLANIGLLIFFIRLYQKQSN